MLNQYAVPVRPARALSFGLYTLIVSLLFILIGLLLGLLGLIGSLVGMNVFFQIGGLGINGFVAGAAGIFIMPAVFALTGSLVSLITYLPVNWVIQRF